MALSYFSLQTWEFINTNFLGLLEHIPDSEKEDFDFSFDNVNPEDTFKNVVIGTQKYLFNTNPEKMIEAKSKLKKLVGYYNIQS